MKIVADESLDGRIIDGLRLADHDVLAFAEASPGAADEEVLASADSEGVLLLTVDKDFGELVYRRQLAHCGVMLLRQAGLSFTV